MRYDWYGTCPKCKHMGWCDYKGKAHIHKDGPGSDTYKVLIYKCKNCGRKFGFSSLAATFQNRDLNNEEEDDDDWKKITELLAGAYEDFKFSLRVGDFNVSAAMLGFERALDIAKKHCGCDS